MPAIDTLHELLKHELKDLYSAETQIIDALPKMVEAASNEDLKKALQQHLTVTETQKGRLEKIQEILGDEKQDEKQDEEKPGFFANLFKSKEGEEHCKAMEGLVKEGNSLLGEDMTPEVKDAAIIAAAQKIEHYEISSYGTARAYALQLKLTDVANLLDETLKEEYDANDSLTELALSKVNLDAESEQNEPQKKEPQKKQSKQKEPEQKESQKKGSEQKKRASKGAVKTAKKAAPKKAAPKKAKAASGGAKKAKAAQPKKSAPAPKAKKQAKKK